MIVFQFSDHIFFNAISSLSSMEILYYLLQVSHFHEPLLLTRAVGKNGKILSLKLKQLS